MPCCKAEEFENWCEGEELFEYQGEQYCVFHLPNESQDKPKTEEFNKLVFARIDQAKKAAGVCDLSGVQFPGDIDFSGYGLENPLPGISFGKATFSGEANFRKATFSGMANFLEATFSGMAEFWEATFSGMALFWEATFSEMADFQKATFSGEAGFGEATFSGMANFLEATFSGSANFLGATFSDTTIFGQARFQSGSLFGYIRAKNKFFLDKAMLDDELEFWHAEFEQIAIFNDTTMEAVDFKHSHFHQPAYFKRTNLGSAKFDSCLVDDQLEFDQVNLLRAEFNGAPLEKFRFIDCTWPEHKGRMVVYEARQVRKGKKTQGFVKLDKPEIVGTHESKTEAKKLADIFRRLKKQANIENDQPLVSDWHYWEKEMQRIARKQRIADFNPRRKTWWIDLGMFLALQIYKTTSGYGESPGRALTWLTILVLAPLLPWLWSSLGLNLIPGYEPLVWWCNEVFPGEPLRYLPLLKHSPDDALTRGTKLWMGLWQALIYLQTAWAGLALRNKMRR